MSVIMIGHEMVVVNRGIVTVTNKDKLEKLKLFDDYGWQLISTGGTGDRLAESEIKFTPVEEFTGVPEMMDGRIKTINHRLAGGVLMIPSNSEHEDVAKQHSISPINLVVCNFYDFAGNPDVEQIDIGGPGLVRAGAKNWENVTVLTDPDDYESAYQVLTQGFAKEILDMRWAMMRKAFEMSKEYEAEISDWLYETQRPLVNGV